MLLALYILIFNSLGNSFFCFAILLCGAYVILSWMINLS